MLSKSTGLAFIDKLNRSLEISKGQLAKPFFSNRKDVDYDLVLCMTHKTYLNFVIEVIGQIEPKKQISLFTRHVKIPPDKRLRIAVYPDKGTSLSNQFTNELEKLHPSVVWMFPKPTISLDRSDCIRPVVLANAFLNAEVFSYTSQAKELIRRHK